MFKRLDAKAAADKRAEAQRWRRLSDAEKWAEMARAVGRWRGRADDPVIVYGVITRVIADLELRP
jgi:hypothetical protein